MKSKLLVSGLHRRAFYLQTPSHHQWLHWCQGNCFSLPRRRAMSKHTPHSSSGRELGRKECRQLPRSAQPRRKPRASHSFLGPEREEPDSQKNFGSSETLKVLISKSLEEEKSTKVGRCQDRTSLGWPHMASSKQWLYLNVSKSLRETLNY